VAEEKKAMRQSEPVDMATPGDIAARLEAAIGALSDADVVRLCKKMSYWAGGASDGDKMALFNEAILRTLDGARHWPSELPFEVFIFGAMKSIANGQRRLKQANSEISETDLDRDDGDHSDDYLDRIEGSKGTDEVLIARHALLAHEARLDALKAHFKGDDNVELVLAALEDGTPRHVLIEEFGMTLTEYESARKKLRRGADVIFRGRRTK